MVVLKKFFVLVFVFEYSLIGWLTCCPVCVTNLPDMGHVDLVRPVIGLVASLVEVSCVFKLIRSQFSYMYLST